MRLLPQLSGVDIRASADPDATAGKADVIVTVTTSDTPVFPGRAVRDGTLVILAGANRPQAREADDDLIARATVFADHREGCVERAGDLRIPLQSGALTADRIAGEIGSLWQAAAPPRPGGVIVFKSMGVIAQDIALAELVLARAEESESASSSTPRPGTA